MELISQNRSFGGWNRQYKHASQSLNCQMRFAIYLPPQAEHTVVPVLYWLSGLTCTDENFMHKSGAQRMAAELGIAIVAPDTSPRGDDIADDEGYDLGQGAGFYVNATQLPWSQHYRMYDYVVDELPTLIEGNFAVTQKRAISGHSMGGHGALMISLRNPGRYLSTSAFSPICNPMDCPWGQKAFSAYLGFEQEAWRKYDSCALLDAANSVPPILIDQGEADNFLAEQLKPQNLVQMATKKGFAIQLRKQPDYDHSYFFIASFIAEHLRFHAKHLL